MSDGGLSKYWNGKMATSHYTNDYNIILTQNEYTVGEICGENRITEETAVNYVVFLHLFK